MSILKNFDPPFLPIGLVRHTFIDTGMADFAEIGDGCSLRNALYQDFTQFHGIEISEKHYHSAVSRMGNFCGTTAMTLERSCSFYIPSRQPIIPSQSVTLHLGSSPVVLPKILNPSHATTIWCDAHFQGMTDRPYEKDDRYGECPLLEELKVIVSVPWDTPPIILIDDAAQLGCSERWWQQYGGNFNRSHWPSFGQIMDILEGYTAVVHGGIIYCWQGGYL